MPKVWNKRDPNCPKDAVYVGRPSKWGNPARMNATKRNRQEVIRLYRIWLEGKMSIGKLDPIELCGKDLVCWCAPLPCHGDVLLELANREERQDAQSRSNPVA